MRYAYEIQIIRAGVPFEIWAAETTTPSPEAVEQACQQQRTLAGEHSDADRYVALEDDVDNDVAVALAWTHAAEHMPALRELAEAG